VSRVVIAVSHSTTSPLDSPRKASFSLLATAQAGGGGGGGARSPTLGKRTATSPGISPRSDVDQASPHEQQPPQQHQWQPPTLQQAQSQSVFALPTRVVSTRSTLFGSNAA
jgi:hypothetical protein